ncbi:MAG: flagellar basal body protein FliL [Micavibrio aeruginosavorus]|uniref:Flagellar protein FliL n=1 Tax=Micavibrio aeruginosavorus TaxID=349221 RepID=A0A2W5N5P9_9BACT|nr:MAG: flagellar basal body protein FliL [Micavibrio aeruginosavorus]
MTDKEEVHASLDDEAGGGEGGGKKKMIIIIVALLLILGGAGAGLYFSGFLDKFLKKGETAEAGHEAAPAEGEHATEAPVCTKGEDGKEVCSAPGAQFLKIPDMIVNLNSEDGTPRYLRLSVQLEFKNAADMAEVEKVLPRVVDQFQTYLRELRVRDLRGSAGIYRLQMELLARVNQAAYPTEVQDVLFQEILIQ